MNKKSVPRVDNYVPPEHWGLTENGQKRMSFNYGDGFSAVLVKQKGNAPPKEVFRLRYCIRGRASTLQLGKGGIENYALARAKADEENQAINMERAQSSSLDERIKRIGSVQKERKNAPPSKGFRHIGHLYAYIVHLRASPSIEINNLIILHIVTLLDLSQLINIRAKDLALNNVLFNNFSSISIPINNKKDSKLTDLTFFSLTRETCNKLTTNRIFKNEFDFIFPTLQGKNSEELQEMLDASLNTCNLGYRVKLTDLRSIFIEFFSKCELLERSKLVGIFGQRAILKLREQANQQTQPSQPIAIDNLIIAKLLEHWDNVLSGAIYCGQYNIPNSHTSEFNLVNNAI